MAPYFEVLRGWKQCQEGCTGDSFVLKIVVSQINLKWWYTKRDFEHFYVDLGMQD